MLYRLRLLVLVGLLAAVALPMPAEAARHEFAGPAAQPAEQDLRRPAAPLGSYRPKFVHQTQNNCAFASAAMMIDKWTGGDRRPDQGRMRAASRVPTSTGVGMSELARGVQSVTGIRLLWSPGGGDPLTWNGLLSRLAKGGAAVLAGSYSRLPRHYQRWNREYAALGPSRSGHAVYIERYQPGRRGGRVWMMDPLANGASYRGEWIAANDLRAFAWRTARGLVHATATPEPPPLAGYTFGAPAVGDGGFGLAGTDVSISIPLETRAGWSRPDDLAVSVVWQPLELDPDPEEIAAAYLADAAAAAAALEAASAAPRAPDPRATDGEGSPGQPAGAPDDISAGALAAWRAARAAAPTQEPAEPTDQDDDGDDPLRPSEPQLVRLNARGDVLVGRVAAPPAAGQYRLRFELRRRDGSRFAAGEAPPLANADAVLRGPLVAEYRAVGVPEQVTGGAVATLEVTVGNLGSDDWQADDGFRLVARWRTSGRSFSAATAGVTADSLTATKVRLDVIVPTNARQGELTIELVRGDGVPLTEYGLEPLLVALDFAPPAGAPAAPAEAPQE